MASKPQPPSLKDALAELNDLAPALAELRKIIDLIEAEGKKLLEACADARKENSGKRTVDAMLHAMERHSYAVHLQKHVADLVASAKRQPTPLHRALGSKIKAGGKGTKLEGSSHQASAYTMPARSAVTDEALLASKYWKPAPKRPPLVYDLDAIHKAHLADEEVSGAVFIPEQVAVRLTPLPTMTPKRGG